MTTANSNPQSVTSRLAFIAALPREIAPLVKKKSAKKKKSSTHWQLRPQPSPNVVVYTSKYAVAVCAGMGAARAQLAVEAAFACGPVSHLLSVGWAGATKPDFSAGSIQHPVTVVDAATEEKYFAVAGSGTLVTVQRVATQQDKLALVAAFDADFVDMEAAAVARIAVEQGIAFAAVKAISDEHDAALPNMQRFTTSDGWIREAAFGLYVALRPWLWLPTIRMAQSASLSARNLCAELDRILLAYQTHAAESAASETDTHTAPAGSQ